MENLFEFVQFTIQRQVREQMTGGEQVQNSNLTTHRFPILYMRCRLF